ncbi:MAG TPA: GIY-YIG nuclease family protein [Candidatus Ozemobacteraceae bacterium]|nr:GIY-YIG nuclease family protein [Candidatus Ozemobacteraceae bacterium]HQG27151.1 GIY-YIG nuclease family protein [Candidatus Ozemobacteraceae bacterium]
MLVCRDGSIYTGVTTDVDRRVRQHNEGTGARYTRSRRPVWLAFTEPCGGRGDALRRELALKALTHDEKRLMILAAEAPPRHVGKQPFPRTLKVRGGRPDR